MPDHDSGKIHEMLSVASQWPRVDGAALGLASRLATQDDIQAERNRISKATLPLQARELFWKRLSYLGIALYGLTGLFLIISAVIVDCYGKIAPFTIVTEPKFLAFLLLAVIFSSLFGASISAVPRKAREQLDEQLKLLAPVVASEQCKTALAFVEAGAPDVLAWRDIALRDRGVLHGFDVAMLRALHYTSMAARTAAEKEAAIKVACRKLYGIAPEPELQG